MTFVRYKAFIAGSLILITLYPSSLAQSQSSQVQRNLIKTPKPELTMKRGAGCPGLTGALPLGASAAHPTRHGGLLLGSGSSGKVC